MYVNGERHGKEHGKWNGNREYVAVSRVRVKSYLEATSMSG